MEKMQILLVEDNPGDIFLTREALEESKIPCAIDVVEDGESAISYLKNAELQQNLPDLVFLDINLPRKNGFEVLKYIKQAKETCKVPVVMLSTSSSPKDIAKCYERHANCYITKPTDVEKYQQTIGTIEKFWFQIATLPSSKD